LKERSIEVKVKLIKAIIFPLLTISIFLLLNYRYANSGYYQGIENMGKYKTIQNNLQIVNFGSSHTELLDYSALPDYNGFNFAFSSQQLYYDRLVFESYNNFYADDCVVILPISYFSLYGDPMERFDEMIPRYTRVLSIDKMPAASIDNLLLYRYFPILSAGKNAAEAFITLASLRKVAQEKSAFTDWEKHGLERAAGHYDLTSEQTVQPQQIEALKAILDTCLENGWKPVVITTPFTKYYNNGFPKGFIEKFHQQLDRILKEYRDIPYMNYAFDERFLEHTELFNDSDHLNEEGAGMFMQILVDDIERLGMLI
jgi:hypothetical protein